MGRLTASGSSNDLRRELFPAGFAGEVMALILEVWGRFSRDRAVRLEEPITALFQRALIDAYDASGRAWFIELESPIIDPTYGTELGRNDLRIYPPNHCRQTIFFVVECKRLHVTRPSGFVHLANEYVEEGVQRFVDGQYAGNLPCGGMLGYVMDNRLDDAMVNVNQAIEARCESLKMSTQDPMRSPSSILPGYRWSADSVHQRADGRLCIHHLLVPAAAG